MIRGCLLMRRSIVRSVVRTRRCMLLMRRSASMVFMRSGTGIMFLGRGAGMVFMRSGTGIVFFGDGAGMVLWRVTGIMWLMIRGRPGVMAWLSSIHSVFSRRPMFLRPASSDPAHRRLCRLSVIDRVTLIPVIPGG